MDSTTALAWAKQQHEVVGCVNFQYGSKHNDQEYSAAQKVADHYGVQIFYVALPFDNFKSDLLKTGGEIPEGHYADPSMKRTVVPFRNGIMLSFAAGLAESIGAEALALGNHFGDHAIYPDCRKSFIEPMARAIEEGTYAKIKVLSPFCELSKTHVATLGQSLGVPFELTYSCYKGQAEHCGKCGTCFERKEAFKESGVTDPTVYLPEEIPF